MAIILCLDRAVVIFLTLQSVLRTAAEVKLCLRLASMKGSNQEAKLLMSSLKITHIPCTPL